MNTIGFDTATDTFALGLSFGEQTYYLEIDGGPRHSQLIMDGARTLLSMASMQTADLQAAACMEGPGSFTGLRIGFAAAKGISLALGIPLIPVPTLDCMAASFSFWPGIVLPLMDAKKNAFFTALYRRGERLGPYGDSTAEEIIGSLVSFMADKPDLPLLLTGPAAPRMFSEVSAPFPRAEIDPACGRGHARELLNLAAKKDIVDYADSGPLYLRKSDAELNDKYGTIKNH
jgi:tRNA threonylcarbamoyladenosine biosynthesis protein TsaB